MKPEWCSEEMWDVAKNEAAQYVEWLEPKPEEYAQSEHVLAVSFARALLDAHQRGRRMGMEEAVCLISDLPLDIDPDIELPDFVNGADYAIGVAAAAIRAKMEEQP